MRKIVLLLILTFSSCHESASTSSSQWQTVAARDGGRPLIYRALVPHQWQRHDPLPTESIDDTTKANCTFLISAGNQEIRITVHTFPYLQEETRIPPQAQIARWKKQFDEIDPFSSVLSESHGGFSGLFFEGQGTMQGKPSKVMGWSMRLAAVYDQKLSQVDALKRADYTIKASGHPDLLERHRSDIVRFANSFEFIDELPSPL